MDAHNMDFVQFCLDFDMEKDQWKLRIDANHFNKQVTLL